MKLICQNFLLYLSQLPGHYALPEAILKFLLCSKINFFELLYFLCYLQNIKFLPKVKLIICTREATLKFLIEGKMIFYTFVFHALFNKMFLSKANLVICVREATIKFYQVLKFFLFCKVRSGVVMLPSTLIIIIKKKNLGINQLIPFCLLFKVDITNGTNKLWIQFWDTINCKFSKLKPNFCLGS